jgi:hypothetical protein
VAPEADLVVEGFLVLFQAENPIAPRPGAMHGDPAELLSAGDRG